mgnify:CR=1 FL=1
MRGMLHPFVESQAPVLLDPIFDIGRVSVCGLGLCVEHGGGNSFWASSSAGSSRGIFAKSTVGLPTKELILTHFSVFFFVFKS